MMKGNRCAAILILLLFFIGGCAAEDSLSGSAEIGKDSLEEKGYKVVSFVNESSWELTEKWVNSFPGKQEWRVQPVPPEKFIGKQIDRITFEVENHPLNNRFGKVNVTVFLYEREVIGGLSYPVPDYDGAPYSLEGE